MPSVKSGQYYNTDTFFMLQTECSDRYVVCGPTYTEIREALTRVVLGEKLEILEGKLRVIEIVTLSIWADRQQF